MIDACAAHAGGMCAGRLHLPAGSDRCRAGCGGYALLQPRQRRCGGLHALPPRLFPERFCQVLKISVIDTRPLFVQLLGELEGPRFGVHDVALRIEVDEEPS